MATVKMTKTQEHQAMENYKPTSVDRDKKTADILITYANGGSFTISVKTNVIVEGRGVRASYKDKNGNSNGLFEVTESKLNQLKKKYVVLTNF